MLMKHAASQGQTFILLLTEVRNRRYQNQQPLSQNAVIQPRTCPSFDSEPVRIDKLPTRVHELPDAAFFAVDEAELGGGVGF